MTPQETQLVDDLFDRLAKLETAPRDPEAERLIAEALRRAPHAVYALVQTALLQDEALKRANARIEELQAQISAQAGGGEASEQRPAGFLDSMREAFTGRAPARGSVPSVRASASGAQPQSNQSPGYQSQPGYPPPPPVPPYAAGPAFGSGGSFLGTAASTAAGMIGGALLLDGIRSMFGHHGGYAPSAFGNVAGDQASPWSGGGSGSAADSQLARDAGIDHVGQAATRDAGNDPSAANDNSLQTADDDTVTDDTITDDNDFDDDNLDDSDFGDLGDGGGDSYDA